MGCFLACFGLSHKRKIRKPAHKRHGSYKPLDSSITIVRLSSSQNPISTTIADFEPRRKSKEQPSSKIRKKVRFNLNVQTYEPVSTSYDHFLEEEEKSEKMEILSTSKGSFNLNYRYQNCRDFYDEEEEDMAFEDSDLYDDDDDYYYNDEEEDEDYDGDNDVDSQRGSQEFYSSSTSSEKKVSCDKPDEEKSNTTSLHSVLKPVENINQWRAAKAKTAPPKQQSKENIQLFQQSSSCISPFDSEKPNRNQSKPLLQEIAVDASLSSWLNSKTTQSV
ncbi:uncharacterized protein LOC133819647 isoform X2 [Humulus lupulus]|uniref:uncharacterized protein LOC133819647 isoform X2 n=1 Tax=Humulus lupulus TaxID=3486 RepID=UPI002B401C9A|nr:uncharacterized protein LOC133819647 isoform X2 [Humulus lupulus]